MCRTSKQWRISAWLHRNAVLDRVLLVDVICSRADEASDRTSFRIAPGTGSAERATPHTCPVKARMITIRRINPSPPLGQ